MQIYLFTSNRHPSVTAFTSDKTGGDLPADYAPWFPVNNGRTILLDSLSEQIAKGLQQRGYFLLAGGCAYSRRKRDSPLAQPKPSDRIADASSEKERQAGDDRFGVTHKRPYAKNVRYRERMSV
jgi:hypothetical protein